MRDKLLGYWQLSRLKVPYGALPPLLAVAMLWPAVDWVLFALVEACVLLMLVFTHAADDVNGFLNGHDVANAAQKELIKEPKPLVAGRVTLREAWAFLGVLLTGTVGVGLYIVLAYGVGWPFVALGLFSMFWGWSYAGWPLRLSFRGLGESVIVLCGGLMPLWLTYYALGGAPLAPEPIVVGAISGLIFASVLFYSNLADVDGDIAHGRLTLTARLYRLGGFPAVLLAAIAWLVAVLVLCAAGIASRVVPPWFGLVWALVFIWQMTALQHVYTHGPAQARLTVFRGWLTFFLATSAGYVVS